MQPGSHHAVQPAHAALPTDLTGIAHAELAQAQYSARPACRSSANAPHSLASDAWKGLIFSLMAGNRNAERSQELDKIPPDVRKQLEADIEFVQGVASLYVAVGDSARATEYLNRVENYYLLHRSHCRRPGSRSSTPGCSTTLKDDIGALSGAVASGHPHGSDRRAARAGGDLWANWAVRRAETAMETGNLLRGVEILQAASQDYPDNLDSSQGGGRRVCAEWAAPLTR